MAILRVACGRGGDARASKGQGGDAHGRGDGTENIVPGRRPGEAPAGYWWAVGALVALASAAMLLHEAASWMLDMAPLWGAPVNVRAFSCDAHSLGLVFGYALRPRSCGRRFSRLVGDGAVLARLLRRGLRRRARVLLAVLAEPDAAFSPLVAVQFFGAAARAPGSSWPLSQVAWAVGHKAVHDHHRDGNRAARHLVVQGLVQHAGGHWSPPVVFRAVAPGPVVAGGGFLSGARSMVPGSCFRGGYAAVVFARIRTRTRWREDGRGGRGPEVSGAAASVDDAAGARECHRAQRAVGCRCARDSSLSSASYGMVFGFLHVIPLGAAFGGGGAGGVVPRRRRRRARPVRRSRCATAASCGRLAHLEPLLSFRVPRRSAWRHSSVRSPTAASFCRPSSCRPAPSTTSTRCLPWPAR